MLGAAFALTAVLGVTPSRGVAEELDHAGELSKRRRRGESSSQ
jgi:hypothetical protein